MNHLLLHLLVRTTTPLIRGRRVGIVRYLPPILSIELAGDTDPRFLVAIISNPGPYCYLGAHDPISGVGNEVFKRIHGAPVVEFAQVDEDRVIRLGLGRGRDRVDLDLQLFGSRARVRILGAEAIIESLDTHENGKPRPALWPPSRESLVTISSEALVRAVSSREPLDKMVPGLTAEMLECFGQPRGGTDWDGLLEFRDCLLRGACRFRLVAHGRAGGVAPVPERPLDQPPFKDIPLLSPPFEDPVPACESVGRGILSSIQEDMIDRHASPLRKHLENRRRLAAKLATNLEKADSFVVWRNEANTLAAFQSRIPAGASQVELPDLYGPGTVTTIKLDPALPIQEQIEKRYKRATKLERSRVAIEKRIQRIQEEIRGLESDILEIKKQKTLSEAVQRIEAAIGRHHLKPRSGAAAKTGRDTKTYRRIDLDSVWFVLVGRNDRENEEITFQLAAPDDVWLHAQQVAGSHVVLKSRGAPGNPPETILETAASIAAYHSKARHASLVPVIYTLRKYVRRFKGSKRGQVVCEREKTIFTEPKLPPDEVSQGG
ncbi:MAG: DUF814 domain-containing protein [Candidatus Latescibacterota bacterium]|nr:MAG: DUF814 domain-containing protein [Candidatus Latescibacterota bacterium]